MKIINLLVLVFMFLISSVEAQKIKYKDLFYLLETGNYKQGEPLLRAYLSDLKNADEANANLQMAFIYNKKVDEGDVLLSSDAVLSNIDSAVIYYDLALKYLDEKEIKKNDEYYQAYQRRDIRTGKFGIKLADIQFDIENKVTGLKDKKAKVLELHIYYEKTQSTYNKALESFQRIKGEFPVEKILFLRSNEMLLKRLDELETNAKLAYQNFEYLASTLKKIEKSGYAPVGHKVEILNYVKDGESNITLTLDNVNFWDFEKWSEKVKNGIKNVITPLRTELVEYDQSLNQMAERIRKDSLSVLDKIVPMDGILVKMKEFDDDPMPENLFKFKLEDIMKSSFIMNNLRYKDSVNLIYQLEIARAKYNYTIHMDSLINMLISRDLSEDFKNYESFITFQYKDVNGLQSSIKSELDRVVDLKKIEQQEIKNLEERSKWLIGAKDSIPIFEGVNVGLSKYVPLMLTDKITGGLYFSGKTPAEGYFAKIGNSRTQELKVNFELDSEYFKKQNIDLIETLMTSDAAAHYYYFMLYIQLPESEKYSASICKIYASDGLAWEKNIVLDTSPKELIINENTGDLIIDYNKESYLGTEQIADRMVLNKKGEIK